MALSTGRDITDRGTVGKQRGFELLVAGIEGAVVCAGTALAEIPPAVPLQVVAVEKVGLVAEGAGDPLPTQMVAGGISIKQMLKEPVRAGFPMHVSPMHEPCGHPHPSVVMQPARADEFLAKSIHAGQACAAIADVVRQLSAVTGRAVPGFELFLVVVDAITQLLPHALPKIAPAQLIDQLAAVIAVADALKHRIAHLRQGENAVADVGRQAGDGAVEVITAAGVPLRIHLSHLLFGGLPTATDRADGAACSWELLFQQGV